MIKIKNLSVAFENTQIFDNADISFSKNKINKVLEDLEILNKKELLIENLSAGELQKANIALGLLSGAKLLLLDEPTSNMDLVNQIKTLDIIKKLNQKNITCVIVLHDLNLAAVYGDYFIGIAGNKEIISGNRSEFFKEEVLNKIYGINFEITKKDNDIHVQIVK